jgi:hypothetical protein
MKSEIKVADIRVAYNNRGLLLLLKERGQLLANKADEIEII